MLEFDIGWNTGIGHWFVELLEEDSGCATCVHRMAAMMGYQGQEGILGFYSKRISPRVQVDAADI